MLFVFDWDGTLCNSIEKIVRCLQVAAETAGAGALEAQRARQIIGLALPEAIHTLFPQLDKPHRAQIADHYRQAFTTDATPAPLFKGVEHTLEQLRSRGHRLAVATGKARMGLERGLQETGLQNRFCATRCADETASKPNPLMLHELLGELNFKPDDAVMVGDTTFDLEMAAAAGIRSIGVAFGSHSPSHLQEHKPELILEEISELLHWSN